MKDFYVVALAGQSGAGKSFAANHLMNLGIPVIDGDAVARKVVLPGTECLSRLAGEFGNGILTKDGSLDRSALAEICFSDVERKQKLDSIIHPYILSDMFDRFKKLRDEGVKFCATEAPALLESGLLKYCDRVVLISADERKKTERIMKRDGLTEIQAERRISAQTKDEDVRPIADHEIKNDGSEEKFIGELNDLIELFDEWFG